MRGKSFAATALAVGASVLAVGCGSSAASGAGGTGALAAHTQRAHPKCVTPKLAEPGHTFAVTLADNGKSFCLAAGTGVFVFLHGSPADMWTAIRPSSPALRPRPSGYMSLTVGTTGGYFVAARSGAAALTSTRTPCRAACMVQAFRVTLVISARK